MTTISELYKQEVERFEEEYIKAYTGILSKEILQNGNPWFNASLRQTYLNICDLRIKELKGEKRRIDADLGDKDFLMQGFNYAKQQDINYWKKQKEIIEKI